MKVRVGIIGCGVVGAAIAYQLSTVPGLKVLVYDGRPPHHLEATGAALGVLMAAITTRMKGRHLKLRLQSLALYEQWLPSLMAQTQIDIPYNRHGILQVVFDATEFERWQTVQTIRETQGFRLERWTAQQLAERFPDLATAYSCTTGQSAVGAIYSPQDRQVNPTILTQALVQGAIQNGAQIHFESPVAQFQIQVNSDGQRVTHLCTDTDMVDVDWLVVAAGLGATPLTQALRQPISIRPVLGQAIHFHCSDVFWDDYPVINGEDVNLVPVGPHDLWVGATVEFPEETAPIQLNPKPEALAAVKAQAIALQPALAKATVIHSWQGLRPRPSDRAAPIIERLPNYTNVLVATGHYRNGVLLAPITAQEIQQLLMK
jgi:glycine/D-amino acid oxidase-like deaminating enzyme